MRSPYHALHKLRFNFQQTTSLSISTMRQMAITLLLVPLGLLAGCTNSGDSQDAPFVEAHPISVALRPGEVEKVLFSSDTEERFGGFSSQVAIDNAFPVAAICNNANQTCWTQNFTAVGNNLSVRLGFYKFEFTGNGFINGDTKANNGSYLPISVFPATTQQLSPSVRFAAGGYIDREELLSYKFSDEPAHSLSVGTDGSVWAWGANLSGQLGNGDNYPSALPVQVAIPASVTIVAVAAGGRHSLALADDGSVWSWGNNFYGQLGDGSTDNTNNTPLQVPNLSNVIAIAAGYDYSLALQDDGSVIAWGRNNYGQLGNGTDSNQSSPIPVQGLSNVTAISAGSLHVLALTNTGMVYGWGNNLHGQIDAHGTHNKTILLPEQIVGGASAIAAGAEFSLLLKSNGTVWSWGDNHYGQLGRADSDPCMQNDPQDCPVLIKRVSGLDQILDIDAGERFAIARRNDGSVWAWGDNFYGQVAGIPGLGTQQARQVGGLKNIIAIAAGRDHAIAMSADEACSIGGNVTGRLLAWGNNTMGMRGDGTAVNWFQPTPVIGIGDDNSCSSTTGQRLIIYRVGTGEGSVQSSLEGLQCVGSLCWQTIDNGATVTLTATADAGSQFIDWEWDCAERPQSLSLDMDSVHLCKVRFDRGSTANPQPDTLPGPACADSEDNDDDGLIDLDDPGCSSSEDDSEIDPVNSEFTLTITINGAGEVFDNNDSSFVCYSESGTSCTKIFTSTSNASLSAVSFGIEDAAIWSSGCDSGNATTGDCMVNIDSDKTVVVNMY